MKTTEQAAIDWGYSSSEGYDNPNFNQSVESFKEGAYFAQEWVSPKDEMPPIGELVQVKIKWRDNNDISYDHDKRYKDETYDDFEINQMVGLEVIGWRPIERK